MTTAHQDANAVIKQAAIDWFQPNWRQAEGFGGYVLNQLQAAGLKVSSEPTQPPELPAFVTVTSRTSTSARWWCDECYWGGMWVSPREAFDSAYEHARLSHAATPIV